MNYQGNKLVPGAHVFHEGVPVKLISFVRTIGEYNFWWVETTFVSHPEVVMRKFNHHQFYNGLHSEAMGGSA